MIQASSINQSKTGWSEAAAVSAEFPKPPAPTDAVLVLSQPMRPIGKDNCHDVPRNPLVQIRPWPVSRSTICLMSLDSYLHAKVVT